MYTYIFIIVQWRFVNGHRIFGTTRANALRVDSPKFQLGGQRQRAHFRRPMHHAGGVVLENRLKGQRRTLKIVGVLLGQVSVSHLKKRKIQNFLFEITLSLAKWLSCTNLAKKPLWSDLRMASTSNKYGLPPIFSLKKFAYEVLAVEYCVVLDGSKARFSSPSSSFSVFPSYTSITTGDIFRLLDSIIMWSSLWLVIIEPIGWSQFSRLLPAAAAAAESDGVLHKIPPPTGLERFLLRGAF